VSASATYQRQKSGFFFAVVLVLSVTRAASKYKWDRKMAAVEGSVSRREPLDVVIRYSGHQHSL
jgi:hypothetical protein